MKPPTTPPSKGELVARAEAAAWITRLHGPNRTAEMEQGFQRWLAERPENAREFEALTEIWDLVAGAAPARGVPRLERWERTAQARERKALREQQRRATRPRRRLWLAGAAAVLLAVGAIALTALWALSGVTYVTDIGEQRIVQLDDGTRISLNSDSRLSVEYDERERRVVLATGEALFEVAKRPGWPFVVTAGNQEIRALGTSFVVRTDPERTAITLVEGKVSVAPVDLEALSDDLLSKALPAPTILSPGQRLTLARASAPRLDTPAIEAVTAWRRGEVALDDTPLAEAIAEMNRYDKTRIIMAGPDMEGLVVSGLYHTGDNEGFARSVAAMYHLKVTERGGEIYLER